MVQWVMLRVWVEEEEEDVWRAPPARDREELSEERSVLLIVIWEGEEKEKRAGE
jgi:hypothetical protein